MAKGFLISFEYFRNVRLSFSGRLLALGPFFPFVVEVYIFLGEREGRVFSSFSFRKNYASFDHVWLSFWRGGSPWFCRFAPSVKRGIKHRKLKPSCTTGGSLFDVKI